MTNPTNEATAAQRKQQLEQNLELGRSHQLRRTIYKVVWGLLGLAAVGLVAYFITKEPPKVLPHYETTAITKGDLHVTVTATGTLSARDSVTVGAEISGRVEKVLVDINDKVEAGQLLAEIDPEQYRAKRDEANAQLLAARASKLTAEATAAEAEQKAVRLRSMQAEGLTSTQELEAAEAALARAKASVSSAAAQMNSSAASLKVVDSNIAKTVIRSPIDGIVLERSVEPGEAVTSGLQTPQLFILAADLAEMRLAVLVDEADVGQVKSGQSATFTVDAYPNRVFKSTVIRVKNMPTTSNNVVTYETELAVKNDEGLLRPGMTATATVNVDDRLGALLVANAALRFTPKPTGTASAPSASSQGFSMRSLMPRPPGSNKTKPQGSASAKSSKKNGASAIYLLKDNQPRKVDVQIGATDGMQTAITGQGIAVGDEAILSEETPSNG
jgi:HlyD family secretion protein